MKALYGKKALITGASSGIGQAIAIAYAQAGATVAFTYSNNQQGAGDTLEKIHQHQVKGFAIAANMAELSVVDHLLEQASEYLGEIDLLVNNAGTLSRHPDFLEIPIEAFEQVNLVNLKIPFVLTQEIAKRMKAQGIKGSILNISSMSAELITPGLTHYECSKAALNALTRGAANALAPYGIRVNAIAPGLVATAINQKQREENTVVWEKRVAKIPLEKAGEPQDIAEMAVFLASQKAQWITGSIIAIDGGLHVASW